MALETTQMHRRLALGKAKKLRPVYMFDKYEYSCPDGCGYKLAQSQTG